MFVRIGRFSPSHTLLRRALNLWLALFLALGPATLDAATYYVQADGGDDSDDGLSEAEAFETITHALSVADSNGDPNDEIIVLPGLYDEANGEDFPLSFLPDGTLRSRDGAEVTTISAPNGEYVFHALQTQFSPETILQGFTLRHDDGAEPLNDTVIWFGEDLSEPDPLAVASAAARVTPNASDFNLGPVIRENAFIGEPDPEGAGEDGEFGIFVNVEENGFAGTIENNTFTGFGSKDALFYLGPYAAAGAIAMGTTPNFEEASQVNTINDTSIAPTISGNTFTGNSFGVVFLLYSEYFYTFSPTVDSNTFIENGVDITSAVYGGGPDYEPTITNNTSTNPIVGIAVAEAVYTYVYSLTRIEGNRVVDPEVMGIGLASLPGQYHEAVISSNTVTGAGSGGFEGPPGTGTGIGIMADPYLYGSSFPGGDGELGLWVNQNTVGGSNLGLLAFLDGVTDMLFTFQLEDNVFSGNGTGAVLLFSEETDALAAGGASASLAEVDIDANLIQDNDDVGVVIDTGSLAESASFTCNAITGNEGDGVLIEDSNGAPPTFEVGANNSIYGNGGGTGLYDMRNEHESDIEAEDNYWGTTDSGDIEDHIFDGDDNAGDSGTVDFSPFLSAEADCVGVGVADLDITKTGDPGTASPGQTVEYTLVVTNNGPADATNVVVTDPLPPEVSFVSATDGCTFSAGTVTCELGTLGDGESEEITITVQVNEIGPEGIENTAYASADEADSDASSAGTFGVGAAATLPADIPTTSEWGLIAMGILLSISALWAMRRNGLMVLLMLALLGGLVSAPALQAADRPALEKATLSSVQVDGPKVVLTFTDHAPITTTRDALRIGETGPMGNPWLAFAGQGKGAARQKTAAASKDKRHGMAMTPEALASRLGARRTQGAAKAAGQPVLLRAGERVVVTLMASEAQAKRFLALAQRREARREQLPKEQ